MTMFRKKPIKPKTKSPRIAKPNPRQYGGVPIEKYFARAESRLPAFVERQYFSAGLEHPASIGRAVFVHSYSQNLK